MKATVRSLALLALAFTLVGSSPVIRTLTFEDRVRAQEAIERVYYSHQIGATKPFEEAVPREAIERKVHAYLQQSAALERRRHKRITAEVLAAEWARVSAGSRFPARLQRIYLALGNDPFLIQECFIRPILADRLSQSNPSRESRTDIASPNSAASDRAFLADTWRESAESILNLDLNSTVRDDTTSLPHPTLGSCNPDDTWAPISTAGAPSGTLADRAVWTGTLMLVWGGGDSAKYDPMTDTWGTISSVGAPSQRTDHSMIWTGQEMVVWGGGTCCAVFNDGGRYDPLDDAWRSMSTANAPSPTSDPHAIWTGTRMVFWGGGPGPGGRYDPLTDSWALMSTMNEPSARINFTMVWTGTEMIVWGGRDCSECPRTDGGRYNPATNTWTRTSLTGAPEARIWHSAVWTGRFMIIWGGKTGFGLTDSGALYDPVADSWRPTSLAAPPAARAFHSAVWTGSSMVAWGGVTDSQPLNSGGRYDPASDVWTPTSLLGAPEPKSDPIAFWAGSFMIAWGSGHPTGGMYYLGQMSDNDGDGLSECDGDCDDTHATIYPGAPQICDRHNNDCNDPTWPIPLINDVDHDHDGFSVCEGDCDDTLASVRPQGSQVCGDGLNNDCNEAHWPSLTGTNEFDDDGDGLSECQGDCDDSNVSTHPGAPEVNDGQDNECQSDPGFGVKDEISGDAGFPDGQRTPEFCWSAQVGASTYEVARADHPGFNLNCISLPETPSTCLEDQQIPAPGKVFYYLVRAVSPFVGSWGQDSSGAERSNICVPVAHTFTFVDTSADDIADQALQAFFAFFSASTSDYIFFEVDGSVTGGAWCSERADFYRDSYLAFAGNQNTITSGSWNKWYRNGSGPWSGPVNSSQLNYFGTDCLEAWSWCSEYGLGNLLLDVRPAGVNFCEIEDDNYGCNAGTWRMTIKVAGDRLAACGF